MTVTYKKIASVTVGSGGAANIEFTSIPGTYTDLVLHHSLRTDDTGGNGLVDNINTTVNNSSANYSERSILAYTTTVTSQSTTGSSLQYMYSVRNLATANTFSSTQIYIPNYAGSTNKSFLSDNVTENNGTTTFMTLHAGFWSDTAAITSIKIAPAAGSWMQYSTATLYGISKS
jgi:hypothetical protein